MHTRHNIPVFNLFGETSQFPDVVHCERIWDRARLHDWVIAPHRHSQMAQAFLIEQGHAEVTIDGTRASLSAQECLYVPAQCVHGFEFMCGTEGLVMSFPLPVLHSLQPATPDLTKRLSRPFTVSLTPEQFDLSRQCTAAFSGTGTYRTQRLIALSHAMLANLCETDHQRSASAPSNSHRQMQRFDALLTKHLGDAWRPREYAAALSVTTGHLSRMCRDIAGCSASAYIETAVMTEACRLLAFTQLSVAEVGYRLGYGDPPYFSRRFRTQRGETPSQYRARFLAQGAP